ncbi:unnamed protein product [Trichogramma brassicae]|uniref:Uncharacterized protein n=1 Tax=Trichogramma brassicae TaxID=86971 RepID=A0A6H5I3N8_9HYME|nr:unnamed protein product [Trichogramma brassicae]
MIVAAAHRPAALTQTQWIIVNLSSFLSEAPSLTLQLLRKIRRSNKDFGVVVLSDACATCEPIDAAPRLTRHQCLYLLNQFSNPKE